MGIKSMNTGYKAFGVTISSEFQLPELQQIELKNTPEITIQKNVLTFLWSQLSEPDKHFYVQQNLCMFQVPEVAIFKIENGNTITVSPYNDSQEDQIRLYILGTCMGALLMQRRILPLHGSAIAIDGKAYAIVGDSGAGKSTLASAFLNRGYQLLSDDVIPISLSNQGTPIVTPAYPQQKLWQESLTAFGMESQGLRPIIDRESKFAIPVADQFVSEPLPLAGVIELTKNNYDEIEMIPIQNLERLHTLFTHTYRNFLISRSGLMEWHFATTANIVNKIVFYQLRRPTDRFTAHELVDIILSKFKSEERVIG
ncbi:HPr kinase/phosphorylase [Oceanobacillus sp. CF4.6]|uniref:HPr kinase/phosphorylase n=1 Tax=Oceanobacillus sp. CF4.6 TaxID=3373080 RepID=UPI003EE486F0